MVHIQASHKVGKRSGHSYKLILSCGMLTYHSAFQKCTVTKLIFISSVMKVLVIALVNNAKL